MAKIWWRAILALSLSVSKKKRNEVIIEHQSLVGRTNKCRFSSPADKNYRPPLGPESFVLGQNSMGYTDIFLGFYYTLFAREINNF